MAEENRNQQDEDQSQDEGQQKQPAQPISEPTAQADDSDDVQAYGEPSDGSGGTPVGN